MSHSTSTHRQDAPPASGQTAPRTDESSAAVAASERGGRTVLSLVVVGLLVGAAYWGHRTNWSLPGGSWLATADSSGDEWCTVHNVPEKICIECHAELLPSEPQYGWCREHGVADCPLDHPDVAQLTSPLNVGQAEMERAQRALALRPRAENSSRCKTYQRHVQFASEEAMRKSGVDIALAVERPVVEAIVAPGEVLYDDTRTARLASRAAGTLWRVEKQLGDRVRQGEVLALVDAAEVGKAKSELLQAIAQLRRRQAVAGQLRGLAHDGSIAKRQWQEAEASLEEAQIRVRLWQQALVNLGLAVRLEDLADATVDQIGQRIQFLGLPDELVASFDASATTSNLLPLRSPLDGVVVARQAVAGEVVDTATSLFTVTDTRRMWLVLDVRQDDAGFLALGQEVLFQPTDTTGAVAKGTLDWISTAADDQTRTVKARVELTNAEGKLRANTYGRGRIVLRSEPKAVVVPSEAVHSDGDCQVVFVRDKNFLKDDSLKFFHVREVRTGVRDNETTEIIVGLLPGEVIASRNSVVLQSQLLKSNLGAGCCSADK